MYKVTSSSYFFCILMIALIEFLVLQHRYSHILKYNYHNYMIYEQLF